MAVVLNTTESSPTCYGGVGACEIWVTGGVPTYVVKMYLDAGHTQLFRTSPQLAESQHYIFANLPPIYPPDDYYMGVFDTNGTILRTNGVNRVTQGTLITGAAATTDVTVRGGADGTITITPSGGSGTYEYKLDSGSYQFPSNVFLGLSAGDYDVTIRDINLGCTRLVRVSIEQPDIPQKPPTDIETKARNVSCCSGKYAFSIVDKEQRGIEDCDCSWGKLEYLIGATNLLEGYIHAGDVVNYGLGAKAWFWLPVTSVHTIGNIVITIGTTILYTNTALFSTEERMLEDAATGFMATNPGWTITTVNDLFFITTLPGYYNGQTITITFTDVNVLGEDTDYSFEQILNYGQYVQTEEMNCLTLAQVQQVLEASASICECQECGSTSDAQPQPGAVIVYRTIGTRILNITAANFTGGTYQNGLLVGKTAGVDFNVFSSVGSSGTLLSPGSGLGEYQFNSATGTITVAPDNYMIEIYN